VGGYRDEKGKDVGNGRRVDIPTHDRFVADGFAHIEKAYELGSLN